MAAHLELGAAGEVGTVQLGDVPRGPLPLVVALLSRLCEGAPLHQ